MEERGSSGGSGRVFGVVASLGVAGVISLLALAFGAGVPVFAQSDESGYQKQESPLDTPWTDEVGPDNALPEYPRPQMVRDRWENLNGVWQFAGAEEGDAAPIGQELDERILVPYPVESALSGIKRHEDRMFYRRTFTVPEGWDVGSGERLMLNFGAVDYETTVWVNGQEVGEHRGGYDKFSFDITDALEAGGEQEVVVGVFDPTTDGSQPVGKQTSNPGGIFYTPSSGIWQTVWMEPVADSHIQRLDMTPDLDARKLNLTVDASGAEGKTVVARAYEGKRLVGAASGEPNEEMRVSIPKPKLWSPDHPFLYDLKVEVRDDNGAVDSVKSYFGMREVRVQKGEDGKPRMMLNDRFVPNVGTLDQGFWPDGVYTAPTDEGLKFDLQAHKDLGYNMVRKHIKVEPDRWYYWADKLGLMVWQDMPSIRPDISPNSAQQQEFERELSEVIKEHKSDTSITTWVPYNEGWGEQSQQTTDRVVGEIRRQDPSRLIDAHSGVNCCDSLGDTGQGNIYDAHNYQDPGLTTPFDNRATAAGEYGGVALRPDPEHEYDPDLTFAPYGEEPDAEALTARYEELQDRLKRGVQSCGVSAGIYTEITDLEGEINGMYTYDRQVFKPSSMERIKAANQSVVNARPGGDSETFPPGTPGLDGVSYYPFDEGSGTTTEDAAGNNDATLVNGPTWSGGHTGDAGLTFDGQDDFVDTGANVLDTTGNYSVSAWVRLDDLDGFQTAVSQDGNNSSAFFLQYSDADNRLAFSFANTRALAPEAPETGQWYHLVGVRDAASGQIKLYVNGDLAGTSNACFGDASEGDTVIGRGKFGGDPVDYWDGDIDQVHLYDRALSDDEVQELYESNE